MYINIYIYILSTHIHLQTSPSFVAGTATGGADRIPSTSGRCLQGALQPEFRGDFHGLTVLNSGIIMK